MSSLTLDPDLRQALEDVAKKSPTGGIFAGLGAGGIKGSFPLPDQKISVARAGLSSAERHILKVHRSELAWILEEAFLVNYLPTLTNNIDAEFQDPDFQANLSLRAQLTSEARKSQRAADPLAFRYRTGVFIAKIARDDHITERKELQSLLIASMRLRDSAFARYYYAHTHLKAGALDVAMKSASHLLNSGEARMGAYAHSLYREALQLQGKTRDSIPHGVMSSELALQSGNKSLALAEAVLLLREAVRHDMTIREVGLEACSLEPDRIHARAEARVAKLLALKSINQEDAERTICAYRSSMS